MAVTGNKNLAPIVLFVYNRPSHTRQTLEALANNDLASDSILYIIADGPKDNCTTEEIKLIHETRKLLQEKKWCKEVIIEEKNTNWGLANSIVSGVTNIINKHGSVIVLEDDIVPEIGFLKYMNDALDLYQYKKQVMHISAYIYPHDNSSIQDTLFLNILSCWGWATWDRAWKYYNGDTDQHLYNYQSKKAIKKFNIEGHANYYEQLVLNKNNRINSWAVKWYASWLIEGGYSLFPKQSIVKNIGLDGTGVHKDNTTLFNSSTLSKIEVTKINIEENKTIRKSIDHFYKKAQKAYINPSKNILSIGKYNILKFIKMITTYPLRKLLFKIIPELKVILDNKSVIKNSNISSTAKVYEGSTIQNSKIDCYSYISQNATINNTTIGKYCSIGPNLMCGWGIHPTNTISTSPMFYSTKKQNGTTLSNYDKIQETKNIQIGHDVFIGMNVTILDGVKIGNGAVIGAGAIVSKDIPPYAIAVGNPIHVKNYRFAPAIRDKLETIQWWNWTLEDLRNVEQMILNTEEFTEKYAK